MPLCPHLTITLNYTYVVRSCFSTFGAKVLGIFVLMERQLHRNESSWNVCSRGTKVPQERKFQGANVPRNESSTGAKVLSGDFSLPGTKVQRNEKAWIQRPGGESSCYQIRDLTSNTQITVVNTG